MSERKAINKYYPPDWDPSKVPKKKKNTNPNAEKVRLMVPFSMKCLQCSEYISARRKFNARKEITSEKYMGIKIIRFHIKCPRCNNSLSFQTDPKSAGFIPVNGCARNYESLTATEAIKPLETEDEIFARLEKQEKEDQEFQEQQQRRKNNPFWQRQAQDNSKDAMSNLEEKLIEQKREQEVHDHLMYLQAKTTRLQQSGGQDQLLNQAKEKLRSDLKRDREEADKTAGFDLAVKPKAPQNSTPEPGPPLTVSGKITVKKARLSNPQPRDVVRVTNDDTAKPVVTKAPGSDSTPSTVSDPSNTQNPTPLAPTSVFGDYESSDGEE
ncbi:hypothetical protein JCM33374_g2146 [Metschnikowia sp. JCM 33374]|nr:hypothetical protein JCM33374_g2146 [Metschnikowia sp. JCM 33374]